MEKMNLTRMPSMPEVEIADVEQLARWYRFLLPSEGGPEAPKIMDRIEKRLKEKGGLTESGGLTAALSHKIGHGGV